MPQLRFDVRYPHGVPFPTPWDEVAQAIRDCTLNPTATMSWHVGKGAPVETCAWLLALGGRPETAPFEAVRPVLDACVAWGVPFYTLPKDHPHHSTWSVLAHVRDPARLRWWLDQGGDPAALAPEGQVGWWAFVDTGRLDLLEVLRSRPAWSRWANARDDQGDHVGERWAWLDRPPGPSKPSSAEWAVHTFAWLRQHVPPLPTNGSWRHEPLATFWTQAAEDAPRALAVWALLLKREDLTPSGPTRALWNTWCASALCNRSGGRGAVVDQLGRALEAAELRRTVQNGQPRPDIPMPRHRL